MSESHQMAMDLTIGAARQVELVAPQLREFLRQHEWATGTGAILDPTLAMRLYRAPNVDVQVKIARAALAFVTALDEARGDVAKAEKHDD